MNKFVIFLLLFSHAVFAQTEAHFLRTYGGPSWDYGMAGFQTPDSGYVVASTTSSFGMGPTDIYLIKLNKLGEKLWEKLYGGNETDWVYSMALTPDSGFAMAGFTNSFGKGGYDGYIVRADKNGDTLWTLTIGGTDWDFLYSISLTDDEGFIAGGITYSKGEGNGDAWIVKISKGGLIEWSKIYGGTEEDVVNAVKQTPDGGYLIVTESKSFGPDRKPYIIKTDNVGDTIWTKLYGTEFDDFVNDFSITPQNEYMICGSTKAPSGTDLNLYMLKLYSDGSVMWEKVEGGINDEELYSVCNSEYGSHIFAGYSNTYGAGKEDAYLMEFTWDGAYLIAPTYGGPDHDIANHISNTFDGGYFVTGSTKSWGPGVQSIFINKTDVLKEFSQNVIINVLENKPVLSKIEIHPNPFLTKALINISYEDVKIFRVIDILGKDVTLLFRIEKAIGGTSIFHNAVNGIYFINISTINGEFITEKVIIHN
jgi:hypothetical protein